jgi:gliding motility-associated-like protein
MSGVQIGLSDSVLCQGTYVTFTAYFAPQGNTGISWTFSNGDSVLNVNPLVHAFGGAIVYTVSATPHYRACKDTTAFRVVSVMPQPTISLGEDTSICAGSETITLKDDHNAGNPAASWRWSNGSTSSSAIIVAPGIYFAMVNINNCYASDTITVLPDCYMNIPNVFTPNNDGINDYFYPRSLLSRGLKTFHMNIYNRWGQLIFETSSLEGAGWDGKMNGVLQPEGVFVYIIDAVFRDGQKEHHQGNVTLLK